MVFSDVTFLYIIFPLTIIGYFLCPSLNLKNCVLLIVSLLFYSWGEPKFIFLMLLASLTAYIGGLLISYFDRNNRTALKKFTFITTVTILVLNLLVFKYLNFFNDNLYALFNVRLPIKEIALPIGISFYTFQILSYVIDLYKNNIRVQTNYFYLTLYVSFFPQLIAGPIVRYQTVEDEIRNRTINSDEIIHGFKRFIIGLAKKVIIANNVALISETIYNGSVEIYGTLFYWIAAITYTLQIYFDFSGYSDMAIGLGEIFGFHFLENFNYPYISKSVTEFWRRWHISLSSWFRDYIYIPLGGNRVNKSRWIFNIFVVWSLTGFWHGAQWNFIIWGLYYCTLLLLEKLFLDKHLKKLPSFFQWLYTIILVIIGWVIFNLTDFSQMISTLNIMFTYHATDFVPAITTDSSIVYGIIYIPLGIIFSRPWSLNWKKESTFFFILEDLGYLILFAICLIFIISSSYNPFIYFRF